MSLIDTLLAPLLGIGKTAAERLIPDRNKAQDQAHEERLGQQEIDKIEAGNSNIFVSGARPFLMWILGFAVAYSIVIAPMLNAFGLKLPTPDLTNAMQLLLVLLGAG